MLYDVPGIAASRVLLVGFGKQQEVGAKEYRDGVRGAVRALADAGVSEAALYVLEVRVTQTQTRDGRRCTRQQSRWRPRIVSTA